MKVQNDIRPVDPQTLAVNRPTPPQAGTRNPVQNPGDSVALSARAEQAQQVGERLAAEGRSVADAKTADALVDSLKGALLDPAAPSPLTVQGQDPRATVMALLG